MRSCAALGCNAHGIGTKSCWRRRPGSRREMPKKTPPMMSKTSFGKPGTSTITQSMTPVIITVRELLSIWRMKSSPKPASEPERVTKIPAAAEISSAGICEVVIPASEDDPCRVQRWEEDFIVSEAMLAEAGVKVRGTGP